MATRRPTASLPGCRAGCPVWPLGRAPGARWPPTRCSYARARTRTQSSGGAALRSKNRPRATWPQRRVGNGGHRGHCGPRHDPHDVARVAALVNGRAVERAEPAGRHGPVQPVGTQAHYPIKGDVLAPLVRLDHGRAVRQLDKLVRPRHDAPVEDAHVRAGKRNGGVVDRGSLSLEVVAVVVAHHREQRRVQALAHRLDAEMDARNHEGAHVARETHRRPNVGRGCTWLRVTERLVNLDRPAKRRSRD